MSDARCIEALTETLRSIVDTGAAAVLPGSRAITLPPHDVAPSQDPRVNVFLYQAEIDGALRNTDPVNTTPGQYGHPALPLVLHYLITPYAADADDVVAHRLLGGALQALHSHPLLTATDLADVAPYSDVHQQVESVRIVWQPLNDKDIYSLWSIFQAPYRISVAFEVRVVLIDSLSTGTAPLPVLRRGAAGRGPVVGASVGYPELVGFTAPLGQQAARSGEIVTLHGSTLGATTVTVLFTHPVLAEPLLITPDSATGNTVTFTVPPDIPAGYGTVALDLQSPGTEQLSNDLPFAVSPQITSALPATVAAAGAAATLTLTCRPNLRVGQKCTVLIGGEPIAGPAVTTDTGTITFTIPKRAAGTFPLRLRIDGTDSRLITDRTVVPPTFDPAQTVTVT